jgi:cytochrome c6
MRPFLMLSLLLIVPLSFFAFGFTRTGARKAESQPKVAVSGSQRGAKPEALFRRNCSRCHGTDGRGQTTLGKLFNAPDFTDHDWWAKHSSSKELITIITNGKKNMPAFGKKLTRSQIESLASYVRSFKSE